MFCIWRRLPSQASDYDKGQSYALSSGRLRVGFVYPRQLSSLFSEPCSLVISYTTSTIDAWLPLCIILTRFRGRLVMDMFTLGYSCYSFIGYTRPPWLPKRDIIARFGWVWGGSCVCSSTRRVQTRVRWMTRSSFSYETSFEWRKKIFAVYATIFSLPLYGLVDTAHSNMD